MKLLLIFAALLLFALPAGCAPAKNASTPAVAEQTPAPETAATGHEAAAETAPPGTGEAVTGESGQERPPTGAAALESEIDVLIGAGNAIGPDHLADLKDRLAAVGGHLTQADRQRLEDKLAELEGFSAPPPADGEPVSQPDTEEDEPGPGPEPEPEPAEPAAPYVPAAPDPSYDNFTWTLPSTASPVRLSLPTDIDNFLFDQHGSIGGYGLHAGGHIEGLDHVWIEFKPGTPARSWADGVVKDIRYNGPPGEGEYHIRIDYGENLVGIHMEIGTAYVEVGDEVKRGQEVGLGLSFDPLQTSGEMSLIDLGRTDGVRVHEGGVYVSPFDYLNDADKALLVNTYKQKVIEPYVNSGTVAWGFHPYQPYLTNNLFLHDANPEKLTGTWYLTSADWGEEYPNDQLTFIEADNPYFTGNIVMARDPGDVFNAEWHINGTFEADYELGRVKIIQNGKPALYGIFEIDESGERAKLTIEYRTGSYPEAFSEDALTYLQRDF